MLPIWLLAAMMIMMYYWRFWEPWANAMLVVLLPKLWKSWLAQQFLDVFLGLTRTGPKKASKSTILHNRLNKEKNSWSMLPIWLLAAMMIMMYYWRFWEPWANAMLVVLLPKRWKSWLAQQFLDVFLGLTLTGPKKASKSTILHNRLNKEKNSWSMLPIWLLAAMMIMMYYWRFWEPWANAMLVVLLPKLWKSWLAQLFLDVFLGLTLTGPKKASKRTILHNRLNMEKTPGRCCQSGYLLPWWLWCTIGGFGNPGQMLC